MDRALVVHIYDFTGEDRQLYNAAMDAGTPEAFLTFAEHCMKKCAADGAPFHGADPTSRDFVIELPYGAYRLVDRDGHAEPCDGRSGPAGAL